MLITFLDSLHWNLCCFNCAFIFGVVSLCQPQSADPIWGRESIFEEWAKGFFCNIELIGIYVVKLCCMIVMLYLAGWGYFWYVGDDGFDVLFRTLFLDSIWSFLCYTASSFFFFFLKKKTLYLFFDSVSMDCKHFITFTDERIK